MYAFITSAEVLAVGTKVKHNNMFGEVIEVKMVKAHPCGFVALHKLHLTSMRVRFAGNVYKMVSIDKIVEPNYSSIQVEVL
jgi:hypothetical protein